GRDRVRAPQGALSVAARRVRAQRDLRPERRAAAPAQNPDWRQRGHRRQLPARREGGDEHRHRDRQRRLHRTQHDPLVQERRHRRRHPRARRRAPRAGGTALTDPRLRRPSAANPDPGLATFRRINVLQVCDHLGWEGSRMHGVKRLFAWMIPRFDPARYNVSLVSLRRKDVSEETLEALGIDITYLHKSRFDPATLTALLKV